MVISILETTISILETVAFFAYVQFNTVHKRSSSNCWRTGAFFMPERENGCGIRTAEGVRDCPKRTDDIKSRMDITADRL